MQPDVRIWALDSEAKSLWELVWCVPQMFGQSSRREFKALTSGAALTPLPNLLFYSAKSIAQSNGILPKLSSCEVCSLASFASERPFSGCRCRKAWCSSKGFRKHCGGVLSANFKLPTLAEREVQIFWLLKWFISWETILIFRLAECI